jgi:hypothetical protein
VTLLPMIAGFLVTFEARPIFRAGLDKRHS